jgi:hypothetical protein
MHTAALDGACKIQYGALWTDVALLGGVIGQTIKIECPPAGQHKPGERDQGNESKHAPKIERCLVKPSGMQYIS